MVDQALVESELKEMAEAELKELGHEPPQAGVLQGIGNLTIFKQAGLMIGLAASIALGASVLMWTGSEEMRPLKPMDAKQRYDVIQFLEQQGYNYTMDKRGNLMVLKEQYNQLQMQLSVQGIAGADDAPSQPDFFSQEQSFGVSQRLEKAKLLRQQELYLSDTIASFSGIKAAKVHLAIPKQNIFVKDRRRPSASVLLHLQGRRSIADEQVRSIVDLVSGSVPELEANRVTVTDQFGRLYNSGSISEGEAQTRKEFELEQKRQGMYRQRIQEILEPIVGPGNYSVQVNVDMDFTAQERTRQSFNPDLPAIRSERVIENVNSTGSPQGIPGALTNQPPANANIPEVADGAGAGAGGAENNTSKHLESERNYDLDTTISHTKNQVGVVRRVTVSVSLNHKLNPDWSPPAVTEEAPAEGEAAEEAAAETNATAAATEEQPRTLPYSQDELANIERLIKGAIGYSATRGDMVEVLSVPFFDFEAILDTTEPMFYEQEWFWTAVKWAISLIAILTLIFGVFRPAMKRLAEQPAIELPPEAREAMMAKVAIEEAQSGFGDDVSLSGAFSGLELPSPVSDELPQIAQAKGVVGNDPALVATIVKAWLEEE